ncbi:MAG: hypothetical protein J0H54_11255 [Rhizobiales bacterium]|nr:hypothetical protein [Hyphomicrobiales bacterium]
MIAADPNPTKVEPAAQPVDQDGQQNKLIYDRANPDAGTEEQQLVLPDDGAVDAAPATNESAASREISRIILPGAPGDGSVEGSDGGSAAPGDPAQDGDAVPRKVRTVVIRPDGTIVSQTQFRTARRFSSSTSVLLSSVPPRAYLDRPRNKKGAARFRGRLPVDPSALAPG